MNPPDRYDYALVMQLMANAADNNNDLIPTEELCRKLESENSRLRADLAERDKEIEGYRNTIEAQSKTQEEVLMDMQNALEGALSNLAATRAKTREYESRFGCLGCGEVHSGGCCPPHECRTSGVAWFSTTQAINRYHAMEKEIESTRAKLERVVEALTPSVDTKSAYMGNFQFNLPDHNEDGHEVMCKVNVPWITIKEIMAAIRKRAALTTPGADGEE